MPQKLWYAVQDSREDDWDIGSYDYGEALEIAKSRNARIIAVIDDHTANPVCIDEIVIEGEK